MRRNGRTHQKVAQVHQKSRQDDGQGCRSGRQHIHGDELAGSGVNYDAHSHSFEGTESGLDSQNTECYPDRDKAQDDGKSRAGALFELGVFHFTEVFHKATTQVKTRVFYAVVIYLHENARFVL